MQVRPIRRTKYFSCRGWLSQLCCWLIIIGSPCATTALDQLRLPAGFRVELVHAVDPQKEGSWVALTVDESGRLIAADQFGGLFRVSVGATSDDHLTSTVEALDLPIGHAHGLLVAFDALYIVVAADEHRGPGLYRARDTDADDRFDELKLLRSLGGTGEHGPHSIAVAPDGRSLLLCAGNKTAVPDLDSSRVPRHWGEDDLLPRIWGPIGSEAGTPAPGGWIARLDPDGGQLELLAIGFRNVFDLAVNRNGEIFTFDADAEFDMNTPWYQPTRVLHVVSGTDYGWRSGSGKWPPYFADTLPPVVEVGAGSPTGVAFGYETSFPPKYRDALFLCDWSYGRLLALHLQADGASYRGELEEFMSAVPLAITDLVVNPRDGAIYFVLGGRRSTSGLYRLSYVGDDGPTTGTAGVSASPAAVLRRSLEALHDAECGRHEVDEAWPHLAHGDRFVRHAARIVLERAPAELWQERALAEPVPASRLTALLALSRAGDPAVLPRMLEALGSTTWSSLASKDQLAMLRVYELALCRMATDAWSIERPPDWFAALRERLEALYPTGDRLQDLQLSKLLVFLQSPQLASKVLARFPNGTTREDQLQLALWLRHLREGWTPALREEFFRWIRQAATWPGGLSFTKYIETIHADSLAHLSPGERKGLGDLAQFRVPSSAPPTVEQRPLIQRWTLDDLLPQVMHSRREPNIARGRRVFAAASCFACHRVRGEGGSTGPDLTTAARRFSQRDLLDAILEPDKAISDQYAAVSVVTSAGRVVTGRVVNLVGETMMVQPDMLRPATIVRIPRADVERLSHAKTSMMPRGLLDTFTPDEVVDLLAFLRSTSAK